MYNQQLDNDNIIDGENDFDYQCGPFNQYAQFEECEPGNSIEDEYNRDNQMFLKEQENINLKNKIEELNQLLFKKNKELEETRIKNDNQLIKINKTFDKHINEYQRLVKNYSNLQKELIQVKKEIQNKNQVINNLKNNINMNMNNINNNTFEDSNIIMIINQNLKKVSQNFFQERNNLFNENEYINKDINNQIQILIRNIDLFSKQLINFKNNNINEIMKLKNVSKNNNIIDPQFYLGFIEIINNFYNNLPQNINMFNNLPNYSMKDNNDKIYTNILTTIKILTDYIIYFLSNKNDIGVSYNTSNYTNNKYNDELNRRLKEMSELLIKSNEYLNKSRQENNELKHRYNELEKKYNLTIRDISTIDNINKDKDSDKLITELNKKNQQIKSLEHMIARLTNKRNNNANNNAINLTSKSMLNDSSYYGKIINKKIYNEIKNNHNKTSFYLNDNKFIKDEKNETILKKFLDKYTNGEYGNTSKMNEINNKAVFNIKDEIENLNNELSDDEIENEQNYNEEEVEKKYLMEGKINNS